MSGKTVINISVGIIRNTSLPAVNLFHYGLDFSKLSLLNENVSILYKEYLALIENANKTRINDITKNLNALYFKGLKTYFHSNEKNIGTKDMLNNLIPLTNKINETFLKSSIHYASAYGEIDKDLFKYNRGTYLMKSLPMESLFISTNEIFFLIKSYTLFSHSESSWNNITMVFDDFQIVFQVDTHSLPNFPKNEIYILMHSPNTLSIEGFSFVNPGNVYVIKYSQWNIIRLGKGYDTDCREYDPKKYTRNDCIFDCYQERAKYNCGTNNFVNFPYVVLKKKNYFEQSNLNISKCYIQLEIRLKILEICYNQCHKECHITYYSFTINKLKEYNMNRIQLFFKHNQMPDLTIRHIPEMPFLTFICNFGGILGMWLGVAFVDILYRVWNLLRTKISFMISTNFFINNNVFPISTNIERQVNHIRIIRS